MKNDLTQGSVLKNVIRFSLPYLLSYFLQTLYGMADLFIIGQFEGVSSTTAVAVGSQVMHMLTVMLVGLAMGATVSIGQSVGAGDRRQAALYTGNTVTLFMALSLVLTAVLLLLRQSITAVMSTPAAAVEGTVAYLTVCFLGIPFITAYNIISSIFRGLGDSKSPMYFIAIACGANIALDYFFMGALHLGPVGAALGTMVANLSSHKAGWDARWEEFSDWADKGQALMSELLMLVDEDTEAFNRIMDVFAMPKGTDAEKAARSKALQEATLYATQVPLRTMKASVKVFDIVKAMAAQGNPNSVSDAGVGALMARSAVLGAMLNVKINAAGLKDRSVAEELIGEAERIAREAEKLEKEVLEIVHEKID